MNQKWSFIYSIPTKVYFGDMIGHLGEELKQYGNSILMVYSGDYIQQSGLYQQITNELNRFDIHWTEFCEVQPNPRHTDVNKGIRIGKEHHVDAVLAIGGGSAIDSAKVIAASYYYDGDCWDIVSGKEQRNQVLPVIAISTISATGSEMDNGAVITNLEKKEKRVVAGEDLYPRVSFLNPEWTYTVGERQTAYGIADIIAHILEEYFSPEPGMYMIDTLMEGLLRTVLKYGPIAYRDLSNYEARANLMWAASWAINGFISFDRPHQWSMHPLGHELSAYYDMPHGLSLAIIMPRWLRYIIDENSLPLFRKLAVNAFHLDVHCDDETLAEQVIVSLETLFYEDLKLESCLQKLNITDEKFQEMAEKLCSNGVFDGYRKMGKEDVLSIYRSCL